MDRCSDIFLYNPLFRTRCSSSDSKPSWIRCSNTMPNHPISLNHDAPTPCFTERISFSCWNSFFIFLQTLQFFFVSGSHSFKKKNPIAVFYFILFFAWAFSMYTNVLQCSPGDGLMNIIISQYETRF